MERRQPQKLAGRRASLAVHYKVDCKKMVQHTSRTGMDNKVAQGHQGPSNLQTHSNAHKESTPAPRGAH